MGKRLELSEPSPAVRPPWSRRAALTVCPVPSPPGRRSRGCPSPLRPPGDRPERAHACPGPCPAGCEAPVPRGPGRAGAEPPRSLPAPLPGGHEPDRPQPGPPAVHSAAPARAGPPAAGPSPARRSERLGERRRRPRRPHRRWCRAWRRKRGRAGPGRARHAAAAQRGTAERVPLRAAAGQPPPQRNRPGRLPGPGQQRSAQARLRPLPSLSSPACAEPGLRRENRRGWRAGRRAGVRGAGPSRSSDPACPLHQDALFCARIAVPRALVRCGLHTRLCPVGAPHGGKQGDMPGQDQPNCCLRVTG